jgi:phosphatidylserine/phosphatidylglycerophosphate/cardiolipin synthase-like enzyme
LGETNNLRKTILSLILLIVLLGCSTPCQAYSTEKAIDANWYTIQPAQYSVYFPMIGQDPAPTLINLYNSANNTIDVAIYSITNMKIVEALENAKQRGIKIRIIGDRIESKDKYMSVALARLSAQGIPVLINSHAGLMHLKVSIIDKSFATTGSYNYTLSASQTNDEMFMVCTEPMFINLCQEQFDRMWADTKGFEKFGGN